MKKHLTLLLISLIFVLFCSCSDSSIEAEHNHDHEEEILSAKGEERPDVTDIEVAAASAGLLEQSLSLTGEITINPNTLAHIVPRVPGIVRAVYKNLGDRVENGTPMAVVESRELTDLQSDYLTALENRSLALANFEGEEMLWKKKISSDLDYLLAKKELVETRIDLYSAEQKLLLLGFDQSDFEKLQSGENGNISRYVITAPVSGTIIEKHITRGEALSTDSNIFSIADLTHVWVELVAFPRDLPLIRTGQRISVTSEDLKATGIGTIFYVSPILQHDSRSAAVRALLPNSDGNLRPGTFVTADVEIGSSEAQIIVPKSALILIEGEQVIFIRTPQGFEPRPVITGRESKSEIEVLEGIEPGEIYARTGAFTLKSAITSSGTDPHAGHGH